MDASQIEAVLDPQCEGWRPATGESHEAFVLRKARSRPKWWELGARKHFDAAFAEAMRRGVVTTRHRALVLPFWVGDNPDEVERDDEWERQLVVFDGDRSLVEVHGSATIFWAEIEVACERASFVMPGRAYGPGIDVDRHGPFCVVEALMRVRVERVLRADTLQDTPKPKVMVPAFSVSVEGIDLDRLPADVADVARQSMTRMRHVEGVGEDD